MQLIDKLTWVLVQDHKVLFVRSKGKDAFYTPGGKREPGETDNEALVREIKEELTVDLEKDSVQYLATFRAQAHGKPAGTVVQLTCYTATYSGTLAASGEIAELAWLQKDHAVQTTDTGEQLLSWLQEHNYIC